MFEYLPIQRWKKKRFLCFLIYLFVCLFYLFIYLQIAMCWLVVVMTATMEAGLQLLWINWLQHWQSKPNADGYQTVPLCFAHGEAQPWETLDLMSGERSANTRASALLNVRGSRVEMSENRSTGNIHEHQSLEIWRHFLSKECGGLGLNYDGVMSVMTTIIWLL